MSDTRDPQHQFEAARVDPRPDPQAGPPPPSAGPEQPDTTSAAPATGDAPLPSQVAIPEAPTAAQPTTRRDTGHLPNEFWWMGSLQSLMVTVVIAVFVITFIVQAFQIPSGSMEDTLLIGDYLLVDKAQYGPAGAWDLVFPYRTVTHGDIIVFRYPVHPSQHFVKRVIGVPGDRVRIARGRVLINGRLISEPYAVHKFHNNDSFRDNFPNADPSPGVESPWYLQMQRLVEDGELIVPQDSFFVLGDNRDDSLDSRYWGFVPRENIIGRPLLIYWSMNRLDGDESPRAPDGKLARFTRALSTVFQNLRWHRMMRLVY